MSAPALCSTQYQPALSVDMGSATGLNEQVPASWEEMDALQEAELKRGKAQVGGWDSDNGRHKDPETQGFTEQHGEWFIAPT